MKTTLKIMLFFVILLLAACKQSSEMLTVINSDGSCYREITVNADSSMMVGKTQPAFVAETDSSWTLSWKYSNEDAIHTDFPLTAQKYDSIIRNHKRDTINGGSLQIIARKDFSSVKEMSEKFHYVKQENKPDLNPEYYFEKKFRWFYTYYTYRETYKKLLLNFPVPLEKYLKEEEANYWFNGSPDITKGMTGMEARDYLGDLENNFNNWLLDNYRTRTFDEIVKNYGKMKNPPVTKEKLFSLMDTIVPLGKLSVDDDKNDLEKMLNEYFKTNAFSVFWNGKDSIMKKTEDNFSETLGATLGFDNLQYKLRMPGKTLKTTASVAGGDTLEWKISSNRMITGDYVIEAQSRKTNTWAFILTAVIICIAIGSFAYKPRK
ncbi:MAG: hypothetical protein H6Q19_546 [Bacteroidetes bacterium]|nr:hypothetical protein [Bacteroidota bacterium]